MFRTITLEVSLKPFRQTDEAFIRSICAGIFEQWAPFLKHCTTVSLLLWASDGSEILDYAGKMEDPFEWCYFIGTANLPLNPTGEDSISPHTYKYLYTEHPPVMTYGILRDIVRILKEEGKKRLPHAKILVGDTFDIGPEFALSDFKYRRHEEICTGSRLDRKGFVDCTARLQGDDRPYAAYPDGIPEGTSIGTFLGRQSELFLRDMEMDYLWLSNGFGFSADHGSYKARSSTANAFTPKNSPEPGRRSSPSGRISGRPVPIFLCRCGAPITPWASIMPPMRCRCMRFTAEILVLPHPPIPPGRPSPVTTAWN